MFKGFFLRLNFYVIMSNPLHQCILFDFIHVQFSYWSKTSLTFYFWLYCTEEQLVWTSAVLWVNALLAGQFPCRQRVFPVPPCFLKVTISHVVQLLALRSSRRNIANVVHARTQKRAYKHQHWTASEEVSDCKKENVVHLWMWTDRQTVDKVSHNGSGKRLVKNLNENTFNVVYLKAYFVEKYISLLFFFFFYVILVK